MKEGPQLHVVRDRILGAATQFLVGTFFSFLLAVVLYLLWEREQYDGLLQSSVLLGAPGARTEVVAVLISKTVLALAPAFVLSAVLSFFKIREALRRGIRTSLLAFGLFFLLADGSLFFSVGRHLRDVWAFRHVPQGHQAAGDASVWIGAIARALLLALLAGGATEFLWARTERMTVRRFLKLSSSMRAALSGIALFVGAALSAAMLMPFAGGLGLDSGTRERLYEALPFDPRWRDAWGSERRDTALGRLEQDLETSYRRHFGALKHQVTPMVPELDVAAKPPVVFIVVESLRRDALTREHMPRLSAWAQKNAVVFSNHEAGTYSSEAGLFSLLYGRSNIVFHETLDADIEPLLFRWMRSLGYEVGYFTGHPIIWLRREEFLSKKKVDRFEHDDRGAWPEWDKAALATLTRSVHERKGPTFSLAFLMSTHFEYQYPARYERFKPVAHSQFNVTDVSAMGEADRIPHWNRYRNSLAFLDDLITDAVEQLPPEALVVITGDHGESFYEGKLYGHGYAFSDYVLKVPLVVRFPGKAAAPYQPHLVSKFTLHRDLPGILLRFLQGEELFLDGYHGRQTFWETAPKSVLSSYSAPNKHRVFGMLRLLGSEPVRLRITLSSEEPRLRVLGFENTVAQPIAPPELTSKLHRKIVDAFDNELTRLSR